MQPHAPKIRSTAFGGRGFGGETPIKIDRIIAIRHNTLWQKIVKKMHG